MKRAYRGLFGLILGALVVSAEEAPSAGFRPARIFSDNLVLQRDLSVPVWGWSEVDQTITVRFNGQQVATEAYSGERWQVRLAPMPALAEPAQMILQGSESGREVIVSNIVVGDVWFCMGQSNMEMIMGFESEDNYQGILTYEEELKDTDYPRLRLLNVPKTGASFPVPDIAVQWVESTPKTAEFFSAVAYIFGRELHRESGVPVGLIHVSMGGAFIERFLPREIMVRYPERYRQSPSEFSTQWNRIEAAANKVDMTARQVIEAWQQAVLAFCADAPAQPPSLEWKDRNYSPPRPAVWLGQGPGSMYYGMMAPLIPYGIKGFVWYQGESNLADGEMYGRKLTAWVDFLRDQWRQGEPAFYAVELVPYDYHKADWPMKDAPADQRDKLNRGIRRILRLPNTATVNTDDLTDELNNLHPRNKAPIGKRLAELALGHRGELPILETQTKGE